ncbi:N-acetylmuramoyl-L-alanine amidase [Phycicoccus badiiscoriae]|uniref:N-acetylmuramoyl-L-alanine amidase n=1 Tax=Pedococcus badiiscoriae TaxID=642776 RepID=A0A852WMK3_9MICO|nr:N-acetylmuramoyl-L-alanine amidase [Pedococcus badiiscoriae]NYG07475.1 N-acetylmuramoyl-L-alanine amidase [Pedococcus badiiscoriae]
MAVVTPAMAGTPGAVAAARPLGACASGLPVSHRTVVFLDPGHGANVAPTKATSGGSTGIYSGENTSGGGEDANVFTVALRAKALLEQAGYKVVLSRTSNPDRLRRTLWQKGNAAETANSGKPADIAVSLHTDAKANIGAGQIYYDNQGGYRQNNSNSTRRVFDNPAVAAKSKAYGVQFQKVRNSLQGTWIGLYAGHHFAASRNLGSYGTIPIVMLSAQHVPWVYNEFGRTTSSGLSSHDISVYVTSVVRGVEHSIGPAVVGCTP